jgi:hypothetical protein
MQTALEWVLETILDEIDTIIDKRVRACGGVDTQAAMDAGRKAMEPTVRAMVRSETAARMLREAGAEKVRHAVRSLYESAKVN